MKKIAISLIIMLSMAFSAVAEAYDASSDINAVIHKAQEIYCNATSDGGTNLPSHTSHSDLAHIYSQYNNVVATELPSAKFTTVIVSNVTFVPVKNTIIVQETLRYSHYDVFDTYPHTPPPHLS